MDTIISGANTAEIIKQAKMIAPCNSNLVIYYENGAYCGIFEPVELGINFTPGYPDDTVYSIISTYDLVGYWGIIL